MNGRRWAITTSGLIGMAAVAVMAGCGQYALRGRVIEGPVAAVQVVAADDPRLTDAAPIPNASVQFTLDPASLGRKPLGSVITEEDGSFVMHVDEFGAGFLEYELGVLAQAAKHRHTQATIAMPPAKRRIVITLPAGRDRYRPPTDPLQEARPYLR